MKILYQELAERIRGEVPDLERVGQRALAAWSQAKRMPDEGAYLDSVALNLHGFYSGLERLFELIARHMDRALPAGETWHRDLLQRMGAGRGRRAACCDQPGQRSGTRRIPTVSPSGA